MTLGELKDLLDKVDQYQRSYDYANNRIEQLTSRAIVSLDVSGTMTQAVAARKLALGQLHDLRRTEI